MKGKVVKAADKVLQIQNKFIVSHLLAKVYIASISAHTKCTYVPLVKRESVGVSCRGVPG